MPWNASSPMGNKRSKPVVFGVDSRMEIISSTWIPVRARSGHGTKKRSTDTATRPSASTGLATAEREQRGAHFRASVGSLKTTGQSGPAD